MAKSLITARLRAEAQLAQSLSGAGAVLVDVPTTLCTSTGATQALTLADAKTKGRRKRIVHVVDGGSVVLTAGSALHLANSLATITLADVRDWIELEWTGSAWQLIGWYGTGVTFT